MALAAIPAILGVVGGGVQAYGAYQQASYESDMANYNASVKEAEAKQVQNETRERLRRQRTENSQFKDSQRAAFAKAGITSTGTPLSVMSQTAADLELAALDTAYQGESERQSLMQEAAVNRINAKQIKRGRNIKLGTDVLSTSGGLVKALT